MSLSSSLRPPQPFAGGSAGRNPGASPPLAMSALLLHSACTMYDTSRATVSECDSLLLATPFRLLTLNTALLDPFLAPLAMSAPKADGPTHPGQPRI